MPNGAPQRGSIPMQTIHNYGNHTYYQGGDPNAGHMLRVILEKVEGLQDSIGDLKVQMDRMLTLQEQQAQSQHIQAQAQAQNANTLAGMLQVMVDDRRESHRKSRRRTAIAFVHHSKLTLLPFTDLIQHQVVVPVRPHQVAARLLPKEVIAAPIQPHQLARRFSY